MDYLDLEGLDHASGEMGSPLMDDERTSDFPPLEFTSMNIMSMTEEQTQMLMGSMSEMTVTEGIGSVSCTPDEAWMNQFMHQDNGEDMGVHVATEPDLALPNPPPIPPPQQYTYLPAEPRQPAQPKIPISDMITDPAPSPSRGRGSQSPSRKEKEDTKRSASRERAQQYSPYGGAVRGRSGSPHRRSPSPQKRPPPSPSPVKSIQSPSASGSPAPLYSGGGRLPVSPASGGVRRPASGGIRRTNSDTVLPFSGSRTVVKTEERVVEQEDVKVPPPPVGAASNKVPPPRATTDTQQSALRIVPSAEGGYRLIIPQEALAGLAAKGADNASLSLLLGNAMGAVGRTTAPPASDVKPGIRQAAVADASTNPSTVEPLPSPVAEPAVPPKPRPKNPNRPKNYKCSKCGQPKKGHVCQYGMIDGQPKHPIAPEQLQLILQQQQALLAMGQQMGLIMQQQQASGVGGGSSSTANMAPVNATTGNPLWGADSNMLTQAALLQQQIANTLPTPGIIPSPPTSTLPSIQTAAPQVSQQEQANAAAINVASAPQQSDMPTLK